MSNYAVSCFIGLGSAFPYKAYRNSRCSPLVSFAAPLASFPGFHAIKPGNESTALPRFRYNYTYAYANVSVGENAMKATYDV